MNDIEHMAKNGSVDDGESDDILTLQNTTVSFEMEHGNSKVLNDVDLSIRRGELLGVVGESGSGKSMLASSLLDAIVDPGLLSGNITYYPQDTSPVDILEMSSDELKRFRWEEISMVFQGALSSFNPTLKIKGHFQETLKAHDEDVNEKLGYARELLEDLHLDPDRIFQSYAHELSGGMKQRVSIALSLLLEPEVLVMDEPTAALDLLMQRSIISLLNNIKNEYNITVVFVTHDLELVATIADRFAVMYAFEVIEVGLTSEILSGSRHPYTRALINSTPDLETPIDEMKSIEGEGPSPTNIPSGCSYHPRCPMSDEKCVDQQPIRYKVNPNHNSACHYWETVPEEIPMNTES